MSELFSDSALTPDTNSWSTSLCSRVPIRRLALSPSESSGYLKMLVAPLVYICRSSSPARMASATSFSTRSTTWLWMPASSFSLLMMSRLISSIVSPLRLLFNRMFRFRISSSLRSSVISTIVFLMMFPSTTTTTSSLFFSIFESWMNLSFVLW